MKTPKSLPYPAEARHDSCPLPFFTDGNCDRGPKQQENDRPRNATRLEPPMSSVLPRIKQGKSPLPTALKAAKAALPPEHRTSHPVSESAQRVSTSKSFSFLLFPLTLLSILARSELTAAGPTVLSGSDDISPALAFDPEDASCLSGPRA